MATDAEIASRALLMLGESELTALSDDTTPAEIATLFFEPTVEWLLSKHRWNFAEKTALLVEDVPGGETSPGPYTTPIIAGWEYAYDIPSDIVRLNNVFSLNAPFTNLVWKRHEQYILTDNQPALYCSYIWRVLTTNFPSYFQVALESQLAARMATPITQRVSIKDQYEKQFEVDFRSAKLIDAQSSTTERMPTGNRLLAKRAGG